ncbi:MAG: DUF2332 domain-containing protein [Caulobacteraceae bacterium]
MPQPTPADQAMIDALRTQIGWCRQGGAPFTAEVLDAVLRDFVAGGDWRVLLGNWPVDPIADAVALRAAGGLHRLALMGVEPLATIYGRLDQDRVALDQAARAAAAWPQMAEWLKNPPQTNEVMRSAVFLGGFLAVARAQGLPLRMREMGCSGGLNLLWDRYRFRLGDTVWGPAKSLVRLEPRWEGPSPGPAELVVASRRGVDQLPVDLADREQRLRLLSYVWADQAERVGRVRSALEVARRDPPLVDRGDAADWVEAELAELPEGQTTVLYHSYVWSYLPAATQARVRAALAAAGERAAAGAGLAHLAFESVDGTEKSALTLTLWPGGEKRVLADAHPHGRWVRWLAD